MNDENIFAVRIMCTDKCYKENAFNKSYWLQNYLLVSGFFILYFLFTLFLTQNCHNSSALIIVILVTS